MAENIARPSKDGLPFRRRVADWMMETFSMEVTRDTRERNHRFLEEALELVQSLECTASEAHMLVDYVYGRPVGEPEQEVGGVAVTFAALCNAHDVDSVELADRELARCWLNIERIRAKQDGKPRNSPLPGPAVETGGFESEPSAWMTETGSLARHRSRYVMEREEFEAYNIPLYRRTVKTVAPRGKPCTCDNCLGSSCACRVDAGEKLGELWYCRKRAESQTNTQPKGEPPVMNPKTGVPLVELSGLTPPYSEAAPGSGAPAPGAADVDRQLAEDVAIFGAAYCRIDNDGTKVRLHPRTVMVDEQPADPRGAPP